MYYDRDGKKIVGSDRLAATLKWGQLFENMEYKIVKQDTVGAFWVSTVWLGLEHGFDEELKPLIFETMVFKKRKDGSIDYTEIDVERYSTEKDALEGHERYVKKYSV